LSESSYGVTIGNSATTLKPFVKFADYYHTNMLARKMGFSFFAWDGKDPTETVSAQLLGISPEIALKVENRVKEILSEAPHLF
jgi:hypothetical protein